MKRLAGKRAAYNSMFALAAGFAII